MFLTFYGVEKSQCDRSTAVIFWVGCNLVARIVSEPLFQSSSQKTTLKSVHYQNGVLSFELKSLVTEAHDIVPRIVQVVDHIVENSNKSFSMQSEIHT